MSITIPQTIEDAKKRLGQIEKTERLTGWERAAIVWAHTGRSRGRPAEEENGADAPFTSEQMADHLGVSRDTIKRARKAWAWAMQHANAPDVKPGDADLTLPSVKYPPLEESGARGERGMRETLSSPERAKEALRDPKVREVVAQAIAEDRTAADITQKAITEERVKRATNTASRRQAREEEPEPIVPSSVLRGIANAALELKRELETLLDMAEQHPEVIELVRHTSNMGGSPDYFRYGIDELAPVIEKAQDVFGQYIASEAARQVTA